MTDTHHQSLSKPAYRAIESTSSKECPLEAVVTKSQATTGATNVNLVPSKSLESTFNSLSNEERLQQVNNALCKLTGCSGSILSEFLLEETLKSMPKGTDLQKQYNAILQALNEMQPRDAIEAMLCSQAIALYAQGMANLSKSDITLSEHSQWRFNASMKLLRLQQETLEKLEKYRRKGEQKVVVQHVQVNDGGKAIVGNFEAQGGECGKNP